MKDLVTWFGFKRHPFDKGIKTSQAVDTGPLRECAARLDYIKRRQGILLLTGDPGVGKTIALRRFVDGLNETRYRSVYTPLTTLRGADLLRHLNQILGLPHRSGKSALFSQIQRDILESHEQKGRTVVLIIDEAHLLQVSTLHELRLLTNFKMDSCDPFILILAGQSDLRRVMDYAIMEPFAQRLGMRFHMGPLAPDESAAYVRHHLQLAGEHEPIFADDALRAVHENAFGIPRRIGALAEQALNYAMFADKRTIDADMVLKAQAGQ
ncbi:MAG: AAA family ATPase [Deltaproteobacteria bacterium]|nr:AAA family ATPase [Deltaproteobacteria bacterium]